MASAATNVVGIEHSDNSFLTPSSNNPPCQRCGKGTVTWRHRRWADDCQQNSGGLIQLAVSPSYRYRSETLKMLQQQIQAARLPKDDFAALHLSIDNATLWRYLKGGTMSDPKIKKIRQTEEISREGSYIYTVTRVQSESPRWNAMLNRRSREGVV